MRIQFLGQGFESESKLSVGNQLIKFFADNEYHTFTGISAFASEAGINGLSKYILDAKNHLKKIKIVTGVDNKGTSKEALEALIKLKIDAYIFYQPSTPIFHPKIYLFEGEKKSELIIGSSNLTSQGLFTNVEASLLVSIDNNTEIDKEVVQQLKEYFKGIFDSSDPNLILLTDQLIIKLIGVNILPSEEERKEIQDKSENSRMKEINSIISSIFPKRKIAKIPYEFKGLATTKSKTDAVNSFQIKSETERGKLVWTRKKLPSSSVQGGGESTNPTGGLRLVQDNFEIKGKKIDQTTYFRNNLFSKYHWEEIRKLPFIEAATIPFEVTIFGKFIGKFNLEVRHKPSGEAGQGNYTTSISWGELGKTIKKSNLKGSQLNLYAPISKEKSFHIDISNNKF